jgi:hypothetical protein
MDYNKICKDCGIRFETKPTLRSWCKAKRCPECVKEHNRKMNLVKSGSEKSRAYTHEYYLRVTKPNRIKKRMEKKE